MFIKQVRLLWTECSAHWPKSFRKWRGSCELHWQGIDECVSIGGRQPSVPRPVCEDLARGSWCLGDALDLAVPQVSDTDAVSPIRNLDEGIPAPDRLLRDIVVHCRHGNRYDGGIRKR